MKCGDRIMQEVFAIPAVGAIIIKKLDDKEYILIQKRNKGSTDGTDGLLELPAGKIRVYENIFDALRREVWEETGLRVTTVYGEGACDAFRGAGGTTVICTPYCITQNLSGAYSIILNTFLCEAEGSLLERTDEASDIRWVERQLLKEAVNNTPEQFFFMHIQALRKYLNL